MADIQITITITGELDADVEGGILEFSWCTIEDIQKYLDRDSMIKIGSKDTDNY